MRVLDIEVPASLVDQWVAWFAPDLQPFVVGEDLADVLAEEVGPTPDPPLQDEVRDTFGLYGTPGGQRLWWLDEERFLALTRPTRTALVRARLEHAAELVPSVRRWGPVVGAAARTQADGHRFVWWRSLLEGVEAQVLTEYVEEGRWASRHEQVPGLVWDSASRLLPGARRLAGRFPERSGPNCFGTVMAAAGVEGADQVWMLREPFEDWLDARTTGGGRDDEPGTVLVWRSPDGLVQHAAVTLGDGWVVHKPSQGWMSPTKVLTVAECLASSRGRGRRLRRHRLTG